MPELRELAATCQTLSGPAERLHCTRAVVAAYRKRLAQGVLLAEGQ